MAGTVSGAIKGWITRKLREKDPNLNFEIVTGLVVAEDITDVEDFLTEQMVEDYGIDKEYLKDKRIYYEDGEWKADQSVQETLQIEKYGVPKSDNRKIIVNINAIKNFVRAKGYYKEIIEGSWLARRLKNKSISQDFLNYGEGSEESGITHDRLISDIAYAIQDDWFHNGFKTEWEKDPNKDNVWKNKYTDKVIPDRLVKKKRLE